ncbi:MAG: UMP kinase [Paludibacteraceae bacterium]|nr:UMP kinase [Paludibacteraceae bacterium]
MYKRILLKLSGESLAGGTGNGILAEKLEQYATQIKTIVNKGVQVGIVIGGGNIFRGVSGLKTGVDRVHGDQMGMLATCINALALCSTLNAMGQKTKVLTSVRMEPIAEYYNPDKAKSLLAEGYVVIFAGGTGSPFFTTDTASALRAVEIGADILFKGTRVDGIYDSDPEKNPSAKKFSTITYHDAMEKNLRVMDMTAFAMCQENNMPLYVFNMDIVGNLEKVIDNEQIGTLVTP